MKKNKWQQIGNFLLGHEKNSIGEVICVRSVSGQWSIRWSDGTMVYAVLDRLIADRRCWQYVEALMTLYFTATNYPYDFASIANGNGTPFMNGFTELVNRQTEYEVGLKKAATSEQEEEALSEVAEMQEILDELDKLDEGADGKE